MGAPPTRRGAPGSGRGGSASARASPPSASTTAPQSAPWVRSSAAMVRQAATRSMATPAASSCRASPSKTGAEPCSLIIRASQVRRAPVRSGTRGSLSEYALSSALIAVGAADTGPSLCAGSLVTRFARALQRIPAGSPGRLRRPAPGPVVDRVFDAPGTGAAGIRGRIALRVRCQAGVAAARRGGRGDGAGARATARGGRRSGLVVVGIGLDDHVARARREAEGEGNGGGRAQRAAVNLESRHKAPPEGIDEHEDDRCSAERESI